MSNDSKVSLLFVFVAVEAGGEIRSQVPRDRKQAGDHLLRYFPISLLLPELFGFQRTAYILLYMYVYYDFIFAFRDSFVDTFCFLCFLRLSDSMAVKPPRISKTLSCLFIFPIEILMLWPTQESWSKMQYSFLSY